MTCIAAIEDNGCVWMASDTSVTSLDGSKDTARGKVWVHEKSGIGFGLAGNISTAQHIRYNLIVPRLAPGADPLVWCIKKLVPALQRCTSETARNEDGAIEAQMLVAIGGHVYEIDPYFAVTRSPRGYSSIGSGCDFAFGSLFSTKKGNPKARVKLAVAAACAHHAGCSVPIELTRIGGV